MEKISIKDIVEATGGKLYYGNKDKADKAYISRIDIDSGIIVENSLFVCIKGERVNGHKFAEIAFKLGALAVLISEDIGEEKVPCGKYAIMVEDTVEALQKAAVWYRRRFDIPVVGVTGSVGKTTTKEMIACALSADKKVLKTYGNKNSQIGVALMMFELERCYEAAVIEMGISENNEMDRLTNMALPKVCVVTNIGVSHIAQLGSRENIRREKLRIAEGMEEKDGVVAVCGNDDMLCKIYDYENLGLTQKTTEKIKNASVVMYGSADSCLYRAYNIEYAGTGTEFDFDVAGKDKIHVKLNVSGIHNVHNAAAALTVSDILGTDVRKAAINLSKYRPMAMRGQEYIINGATVVDDTYNASPDSVKSTLNVMWDRACTGKRYAVLADILELGNASESLHRELGSYIAGEYEKGRKTDVLITFGDAAGFIADEAKKVPGITVIKYKDKKDVTDYLKENLSAGDIAIIKGSRGMKMDEIVNALM